MSESREVRLTVAELKDILREYDLPTSGTKAELIARLDEMDPNRNYLRTNENEEEAGARALSPSRRVKERESDSAIARRVEREETLALLMEARTEIENLRTRQREREETAQLLREAREEIRVLKNAVERDAQNGIQEQAEIALERRQNNNQLFNVPVNRQNDANRVNISSLKECLGTFDGSGLNFESWERQVINLKNTYDLDINTTRILICSRLSGKAATWFHSKAEHVQLTIDELLGEIRQMFFQRPTKLTLRKSFEEREWKTEEPFSEYFHDKIILGNRVPIDQGEIVDYLIDGIPDSSLRDQARIQRFINKNDLYTAFEKIKLQPKIERKSSYSRFNRDDKRKDALYSNREKTDVTCYNCGEKGHISPACLKERQKRGSCFKCGGTDHLFRDCKQKEKQPSKQLASVSTVELGEEEDDFFQDIGYEWKNDAGEYLQFNLLTLLDSGSPISFIKESVLNSNMIEKNSDLNNKFCGVNNSQLNIIGEARLIVNFNNKTEYINMFVVSDDTMKTLAILGRDFFKKFGLSLKNIVANVNEIFHIDINETNNTNESDKIVINTELNADLQEKLKTIYISDYETAVRPENPIIETELELNLKEHQPFHFAPRRLSYAEKNELEIIINDLLLRKIIRHSESEYASPIVLTKRKNGKTRLCVDYRTLNKYIIKSNYPIPIIEDQLNMLKSKKYFTLLDLKDGFHHIKIAESSIKYTSFVTYLGQYEYIKMPFGLKVAPLKFQKYVNTVLQELISENNVVVYMDDILVATDSIELHFETLKKLFQLLVQNKLQLNISKCKFLFTIIEYLGYIISNKGISPTKQGIQSVLDFPVPKNVHEVQSFIGLTSYFRKFVKDFSLLAKPLYDLIRKNVDFNFGANQIIAFETLKEKLVQAPILIIYDPRAPTELHCDASSIGYGSILMQQDAGDKKYHPVFYFSKRTTDVESRYHSFELEMLAIIYALRRFRIYLQGITFKIITDCNSLALAINKKEINPRISRWVLELQEYDYTTEHRASGRMTHVDSLSRINFVALIEDNTFEKNLLLAQNKDLKIVEIKNKLEKTKEDKNYEMRNNVLYRKNKDNLTFYVPECMEKNVLFKYHDEVGHIGIDKVASIISRTYWFPELKRKITDHVRSCCKCIAFNRSSGKIEGFIHNIPKGDKPFDTIHLDYLDIPDKRVKDKKHVLVIIDAFTKFVKLFATKTITTNETIPFVKQYFINYSKPRLLISDKGMCFKSKEFDEFLKSYEIKHVTIATQSPQANGQVERVNRTLIGMLGKLTDYDIKKDWSKVIETAEFSINNSIHSTTNETPSKLLFGIDQRGKVHDNVKDFIDNDINKNERNLKLLREQADQKIQKSQIYNKTYIDKKRKDSYNYKVGDFVMIRNINTAQGISSKIVPFFKGPYVIKTVLNNDRYVVKDIDGFQNTQKPYEGIWEAKNVRLWCAN